jgi:hypothetical protein
MRLSLALLCMSLSVLCAAQDPPDLSRFTGTYYGYVLNGAQMEPITTILRLASGGRLTGEYVIDDAEEGEKRGTVSNFQLEAADTLVLEWTDRDGEGYARLIFTSDLRRFNGGWGTHDTEADNPWNGTRQ